MEMKIFNCIGTFIERSRTMKKIFMTSLVVIFATAPVWAVDIDIGSPVIDAHVRSSPYNTSNYGAISYLLLKSSSSFGKGYMRFDTSSIRGTVINASLTLTAVAIDPADDVQVNFYGMYDIASWNSGNTEANWIENGIVYDNAPGNNIGSATGFLTLNTTYLGSAVPALGPGESFSFSSSALVDFVNDDSNQQVTIMISVGDNINAMIIYFGSREDIAKAPNLSIQVAPLGTLIIIQ